MDIRAQLSMSPIKNKKLRMSWFHNNKIIGHVDFGDKNYEDYTIHHNDQRKENYLNRHIKNENWNNPFTAGSLSRYILWNKKNIKDSFKNYKEKFNFK